MNTTYTITRGSGQTVIDDFIAVGRGSVQSDAWKAMLDILKFEGTDLTASNILITQKGDNTLITFDGIDAADTSILLKGVDYQLLDNVPNGSGSPYGNFIFDGQSSVIDNIDVLNRESTIDMVWNANSTTFLNDRANATHGMDGNDVINAMGGNDTVWGRSGDDIIRGGSGNDKLYGDSGDDKICGDDGNDIINGGSGYDLLMGDAGNDKINGDSGDDVIYGGNGNDTLQGNSGDDIIYGGDGNNIMAGDSGDDFMYGGSGSDFFWGGSGADYMDGGLGWDHVSYKNSDAGVDIEYGGSVVWAGLGGYAEGDTFTNINNFTGSEFADSFLNRGNFGGKENTIYGLGGDDYISTGDGRDRLYGGDGNDVLDGGKNNDQLSGGEGNDTFVFKSTDWGVNTYADMSHDVILDFDPSYDHLHFEGFATPVDFGNWALAHIINADNGAVIVDDNYNVPGSFSSMITLVGISVGSLSSANFDFA